MPPTVMPMASSQVVVPIQAIKQPTTIPLAEVIAICLGVIDAELTRARRARSAGSVLEVTANAASALELALDRMRADGAGEAVLARRFAQLQDPAAGLLPGDALEPVEEPSALAELDAAGDPNGIANRLAIVKLNGGLGTSMGLHGPKSLIKVKPGHTFLDVIVRQVLAARARHGARIPLDSFSTRARTLEALPAAELEWCPPGHGDLYVSLHASGMLATLLDAGIDWAFVSNSDNLGAEVDARIPAWANAHGIPFVMEVVRGTAADRKGGHIAGAEPTGASSCARRPRHRQATARSPTSTAGASTTPTTSGSISAPATAPQRGPCRTGAAADRQPQDRGPKRRTEPDRAPARDGDGRGYRRDRWRPRRPRAAYALRARQDDRRPAPHPLRWLCLGR
jgi:hypothetical protein